MRESKYDKQEIAYLENSFTYGFDIGYQGSRDRQSSAKNILLKVGSEVELWNKLIKEVRHQRVAGPFDEVPFPSFIQSPIGLVPKAGNSGKMRLIFHLSYDFGPEEKDKSLKYHTPCKLCLVQYNDLDHATAHCLEVHQEAQEYQKANLSNENQGLVAFHDDMAEIPIYLGKTDVQSTFRLVLLSQQCFAWLVMMARNPKTQKWQFFVDKYLPFRASISCKIFQCFSDALAHITKFKTGQNSITNYLDDFLFVAYTKLLCNSIIQTFLDICETVGVPIAEEKTEWANTLLIFLGILLNGVCMTLGVPEEK